MKANYRARADLHSAMVQLQVVAQRKREESDLEGRDRTFLVQEVRQLDEALRLLSRIRK